jgi:hypothetical protein
MAPSEQQSSSVPGARLKEAGIVLMSLFLICHFGARLVIRLFFPEFRSQGMNGANLALVIPILSLLVVGALLWIAGILRGRPRSGK